MKHLNNRLQFQVLKFIFETDKPGGNETTAPVATTNEVDTTDSGVEGAAAETASTLKAQAVDPTTLTPEEIAGEPEVAQIAELTTKVEATIQGGKGTETLTGQAAEDTVETKPRPAAPEGSRWIANNEIKDWIDTLPEDEREAGVKMLLNDPIDQNLTGEALTTQIANRQREVEMQLNLKAMTPEVVEAAKTAAAAKNVDYDGVLATAAAMGVRDKPEAVKSIAQTASEIQSNKTGLAGLIQKLMESLKALGFDIDTDTTKDSLQRGGIDRSRPGMAPLPNETMPELDEKPSPEDMNLLRQRARSADVENLTTPAKNIAIAVLKAHPHVDVTSGFRGPERNRKAGGVPNSDHLTGNAIDFGTIDPAVERWVKKAFPNQVFTLIHGNRHTSKAHHLHVSYRPS